VDLAHDTCSRVSWAGTLNNDVFFIFKNRFLQKYIFSFIIYNFVPLPPGCGAASPLPPCCRGGRDLNVNIIYFYSHFGP